MFESVNKSVNELYHDFRKMKARLEIASDKGESVLLLCYYRGEGGLDHRCLDTYAIIKGNTYFAIESYMRQLAQTENSYVFGVLDCGRQMLDVKITDVHGWTADGLRNLVMLFGVKQLCKRQKPIFWGLASHLDAQRDSLDRVVLPDALLFKPGVGIYADHNRPKTEEID